MTTPGVAMTGQAGSLGPAGRCPVPGVARRKTANTGLFEPLQPRTSHKKWVLATGKLQLTLSSAQECVFVLHGFSCK